MLRTIKFCFALCGLLLATNLSAQTASKYGHTNMGNLLELMPDTKTAEATLKVYADTLTAKDEMMTKAFEKEYVDFQTKYQKGELTPVQAQEMQAKLEKAQAEIQKFEQEAQQMIAAKRDELLTPILKRVSDAIKAVATENQYLMIFDSSTGLMLFAADSEDVTAKVKQKLNLQ